MNILALDLATKTGWAIRDRSGCAHLKVPDRSPGWSRMCMVGSLLEALDTAYRIHAVVVEDCHVRHIGAAKPLLELRGAVWSWCVKREIPFYGNFAPTTIKKHATGHGRAEKAEMVAAAQILFPQQRVLDNNQADALCLLDLATTLYNASGLDGLNDGGAQKPVPKQSKPSGDSPKTRRKRQLSAVAPGLSEVAAS